MSLDTSVNELQTRILRAAKSLPGATGESVRPAHTAGHLDCPACGLQRQCSNLNSSIRRVVLGPIRPYGLYRLQDENARWCAYLEKLRAVGRLTYELYPVYSTLYWAWAQRMTTYVSCLKNWSMYVRFIDARPSIIRELYDIDKLLEDIMPEHKIMLDNGQGSRKGRKRDARSAAAALDCSILERLTVPELVKLFCGYRHEHDSYCEDRLRQSIKRLKKIVAKYAGDNWQEAIAAACEQPQS